MSARQNQRSIHPHTKNVENTAKLLQNIAKELYEKNLEIRMEQSRLDELLSRVAEIIFAVDQNYKITLFNTIAESIFGLKEHEAVGKHANQVMKIFDPKVDNIIEIENYAFKKKLFFIPKVRIKIDLEGKILEKYYALRSNYVQLDGEMKEAIISLADITREVEIEKLKDDFISIASHELKTPISIIKNNLWMLTNTTNIKLDERGLRYTNEINQGLNRLKSLVDELLGVSRIEQNRIIIDTKEHEADDLIDESLDNFIETFKLKGIKYSPPQKTKSKILVDKMKFQEVLDNLVSNSIKYAKGEGAEVSVKSEVVNEYLKITVTDNGPGIGKEDFSKIFTKFGRATEGLKMISPGASTGLGLYICKNYVEGMKGKIGFDSQIGKGSSFWFMIPLAKTSTLTIR